MASLGWCELNCDGIRTNMMGSACSQAPNAQRIILILTFNWYKIIKYFYNFYLFILKQGDYKNLVRKMLIF